MTSGIAAFLLMAAPMVGSWSVAVPATKRFYEELRGRHPDIWESFGRPTMFSIKTLPQELHWLAFVIFRRYRALNSRRMNRLGNTLFCCTVANYLIIAVWIVIYGPAVFHFQTKSPW